MPTGPSGTVVELQEANERLASPRKRADSGDRRGPRSAVSTHMQRSGSTE